MNKSYLKLFFTAALFFTVGIQAMMISSETYRNYVRVGYLEQGQKNLCRDVHSLGERQSKEAFDSDKYRWHSEQKQKNLIFNFFILKKEVDALKKEVDALKKEVEILQGKKGKKRSQKSKVEQEKNRKSISQESEKISNKKTCLPEELIKKNKKAKVDNTVTWD